MIVWIGEDLDAEFRVRVGSEIADRMGFRDTRAELVCSENDGRRYGNGRSAYGFVNISNLSVSMN